jgi:hypothetical protein
MVAGDAGAAPGGGAEPALALLVFNDPGDPVERRRLGWALVTVDDVGVRTTSLLGPGVGAGTGAAIAKAAAERALARRGLVVLGWSPGLPDDQPGALSGFGARVVPHARPRPAPDA